MAELLQAAEWLQIRGARTHNLRNINLDLPRDRLVVLTGPSGSGKSSLAFDTLFAEGQRQYIESLSSYARQFFDQLQRPDVDSIEGLEPTICIDQRPGHHSPRSTVATVTEIYDYLRLLYARLGQIHCHLCGEPIQQQSAEEILSQLTGLPEGTKLMLLAPMVRGERGAHAETFQRIRKAGFVRLRINGEMYDVDRLPELEPRKQHTIDAVVDRIVVRAGVEARLAESLQLALKHGEGAVSAAWLTGTKTADDPSWRERLFSTKYACPACGEAYQEVEPRTFSFNSPYGACPRCDGLGTRVAFDPELVVADAEKSIAAGAVAAWKGTKASDVERQRELVAAYLKQAGIAESTAVADFTPLQRERLFQGDGDLFPGLLTLLEQEYATALEEERRGQLELFRGVLTCDECGGERLRPEARSVRVGEKSLPQLCRLAVGAAREFFLSHAWPVEDLPIARPITEEIVHRLEFLEKVGLGYLTLDRGAGTLSGGELQRVRLAKGIGSGLVGVCYILDEPSIGLHPRDNDRLLAALRALQQQGNTVIVVEHDETLMRAADWLVDIGPGAGRDGGQIMAEGPPADVMACAQSPTGRFLSGRDVIAVPTERRSWAKSRCLTLEGATTHNLQDVTVTIPLGTFTCVTGVSGSGKSSLIHETLAPALLRKLHNSGAKPGPFRALKGTNQLTRAIVVDQSPLGSTARSNAATYTGLFDDIRKLFAATKDAKQLGFKAGRFTFNAAGGRCEECLGLGVKKIEMNFLPDIIVPCAACQGARFNRQTLQVRYKGLSIAEVLALSCAEAAELFRELESLHRPLTMLCDVGLGYLPLGQSATTLSGGEAQRVKLAAELAAKDAGPTIYILDEPTTGLHFVDVQRLLAVLQRLVDRGHTVLVVEHHLDLIRAADWVIDLGPDGGAGGGRIVAVGTPDEIVAVAESFTGAALRRGPANYANSGTCK